MTLTRLLEIDIKLLPHGSERALYYAERIWQSRGSPMIPEVLRDVLEETLEACKQEGIYYPPILLRRKKELDRSCRTSWLPKPKALSSGQSPQSVQACARPAVCSDCGGSGYRPTLGGASATLCECESWKKPKLRPGSDGLVK